MAVHRLLLQQFPLLAPLPPHLLESLAQQASIRTFSRREMVLTKGPVSPFFCFLLEGRLQAIDFTLEGREVGLHFVEQGDFFAELSLVDGEAQPEFVIATSRAQILLLPVAIMRPLVFSSPAMAEALSHRLAQRVRAQISQRQVLALANPLQRIAAQLQILAVSTPSAPVVRAPTHQELAIMVNLTRETVTRTFQVLQAQGVIRRDGDNLVLDLDKLRQMATKGQDAAPPAPPKPHAP